jgi:hypothetical protein
MVNSPSTSSLIPDGSTVHSSRLAHLPQYVSLTERFSDPHLRHLLFD